jgi:hypothetical protein
MSFIDHYLKEHNLDPLPQDIKKNLDKLEKEIKAKIDDNPTDSTFEDVAKKYGPQIADIVGRFREVLGEYDYWKTTGGWSVGTVIGILRFVINIGVEVKQLVDQMKGDIVSDSLSFEQAKAAKIDFGQSLVYFIWKTVDPLKGRLGWIPFKKTVEKKLVFWVASMAFDFAGDLINRHFGAMSADGPEETGIAIKVL